MHDSSPESYSRFSMHTKYGTARSWYTYRYGTSVSMQLAGSLHVDSCDEPCTADAPRRAAATWTHVRSVGPCPPRRAAQMLSYALVRFGIWKRSLGSVSLDSTGHCTSDESVQSALRERTVKHATYESDAVRAISRIIRYLARLIRLYVDHPAVGRMWESTGTDGINVDDFKRYTRAWSLEVQVELRAQFVRDL